MRLSYIAAGFLSFLVATGALAADLLPLKNGIYVPAARPCKGASNAEIVNYWGGKSSIGVAQAECAAIKVSRQGNVYTVRDKCRDLASGDVIEGGSTMLKIFNPTSFRMNGTTYRYCGTKVQF